LDLELDDLDTEDEEVIHMEKELKKLRAERKTYEGKQKLRKLEEKKENLRQEIAAEKERKRSKSKDKGGVNPNSSAWSGFPTASKIV
jgi:predicted  nucleic acid-binding Zn-ribbon protein